MEASYITAVEESLKDGKDPQSVFDGLDRVLEVRGHARLKRKILTGLLRNLEGIGGRGEARVTVAKESDLTKYKDKISTVLASLEGDTYYTTQIDETIIGGVIVESGSKRWNGSFKEKLVTLYRSFI